MVNRTILRWDALFLPVAGSIQLILEILGHFFGIAVYAEVFGHSPYTIGFFEAHGLAVLIALVVFNDNSKQHIFWHRRLVAIHVLLGGANLLFWESFVNWNLVVMGVIATTLHGLFIAANAYYLLKEGAIWE